MNTTYARLTGRRAWYVAGVSVWGELIARTIAAVGTETDDTTTRVVFYEFGVGGRIQNVPYTTLTDHRGNALPSEIDSPVVVVIPRNEARVVVVGRPTDIGVRLARSAASGGDGLVDLWIVEAGI